MLLFSFLFLLLCINLVYIYHNILLGNKISIGLVFLFIIASSIYILYVLRLIDLHLCLYTIIYIYRFIKKLESFYNINIICILYICFFVLIYSFIPFPCKLSKPYVTVILESKLPWWKQFCYCTSTSMCVLCSCGPAFTADCECNWKLVNRNDFLGKKCSIDPSHFAVSGPSANVYECDYCASICCSDCFAG
jgi:hypothetical protein